MHQNGLAAAIATPKINHAYLLPLYLMSYVVASAIKHMLKKAAMRAKENGRVTVRPCDL